MKKRNSTEKSDLKVNTNVSLSKTKPAKERRLQKIQKSLSQSARTAQADSKPTSRIKPESQIAESARINLWLIPARLAFFFNGIYYLSFSVMAFLGVFSGYKVIKPFFTLPFDTTFSSFFLLEIAAVFALLASMLYLHAAKHPRIYRWFYFLIIILFIPYHFLSNLQKLQIELPQDFQNYLYFDTIITSVLWVMYLLSIYSYHKLISRKN